MRGLRCLAHMFKHWGVLTMTDFMDFPHTPRRETRFGPESTLPLDGTMPVHKGKGGRKVTGHVYIVWQRSGRAQVATSAHVNDDLPAVEYKDHEYLCRVNFTRDASSGEWVAEDRPHISDRRSWSIDPVSPTVRNAIVAAFVHHIGQHWTPELDGLAEYADATRDLSRAEDKLREAEAALGKAQEAEYAERARRTAALDAIREALGV